MATPDVHDEADDSTVGTGTGRVPTSGLRWLASRLFDAPPETAARAGSSPRSVKWAVDRLDVREKRFSLVAAVAAVVFGVTVYVTEIHNHHFRLAKGQLTPQSVLVLGIAAGVLLLGAVLVGRRAPVGFVSLLTGLFFSGSNFILALPFLALGIWVFVRSYRIQREASANLRAARAEAAASPSRRGAGGQRTPGGGTAATAGRGRTRRTKGPARPEGNKRYTPKKPPPPAPKPSRRERKAAQASE